MKMERVIEALQAMDGAGSDAHHNKKGEAHAA
jgi:hypothetical protein